jgi:hypothetical protein
MIIGQEWIRPGPVMVPGLFVLKNGLSFLALLTALFIGMATVRMSSGQGTGIQ